MRSLWCEDCCRLAVSTSLVLLSFTTSEQESKPARTKAKFGLGMENSFYFFMTGREWPGRGDGEAGRRNDQLQRTAKELRAEHARLQSSETELRAEHARARDEISRPGGGFRRVENKIRAHDRR